MKKSMKYCFVILAYSLLSIILVLKSNYFTLNGKRPALEVFAEAKVVDSFRSFDGTTALNKAITSNHIMLELPDVVQDVKSIDIKRDLITIAANQSVTNLSADVYVEKQAKIEKEETEPAIETMSMQVADKAKLQKDNSTSVKGKSTVGNSVLPNTQTVKKQSKVAKIEKAMTSSKKINSSKKAQTKVSEESTPASTSDVAVVKLDSSEIKILERIVEAEATGEDMKGKILVANVVLNRVNSGTFPDTVEGVVFQKTGKTYQFSPIRDKRYWNVNVTKETKEAVQRVIKGEDYSQGALYFSARKRASKSNMKWFDSNLKWLFEHGGHEFFTNK